MKTKQQICKCKHSIDNHLEQMNGRAKVGGCLRCECLKYKETIKEEDKK